jgi:hypothetical protein
MDTAAKAKLEMLLLRRWREGLALPDTSMIAAIEAIGRDEKTGQALRQVQRWLHHPAPNIRPEEIVAALTPYTVELPQPQSASSAV